MLCNMYYELIYEIKYVFIVIRYRYQHETIYIKIFIK